MGIFKRIFVLFLPLLFLLAGCCRIFLSPDTVPYRVVTQVQIRYQNGTVQSQRQFFREENIRNILAYLRYIDPYGDVYLWDYTYNAKGQLVTMVVTDCDGSEDTYEYTYDANGNQTKESILYSDDSTSSHEVIYQFVYIPFELSEQVDSILSGDEWW